MSGDREALAFELYRAAAGVERRTTGRELPQWNALPDEMRSEWRIAAQGLVIPADPRAEAAFRLADKVCGYLAYDDTAGGTYSCPACETDSWLCFDLTRDGPFPHAADCPAMAYRSLAPAAPPQPEKEAP